MLTCIACQRQLGNGSQHHREEENASSDETPRTRQDVRVLASQIKDMALKASRSSRHCKPRARSAAAAGGRAYEESSVSEQFDYSYHGIGLGLEFGYESYDSTPRHKEVSSAEGTRFASRQMKAAAGAFTEVDTQPREWIAQVEPGVLLTLFSLPHGGNDLKRIRFSRDLFNKWQAQRWWAENNEKVMELYSVTRFNRLTIPRSTSSHLEDEVCSQCFNQLSSKIESTQVTPMVHPPGKEQLPHHFRTVDYLPAKRHHFHQHLHLNGQHCYDSGLLASTQKLSNINEAKMEVSSLDSSGMGSSSQEADHSADFSPSPTFTSDQERELVEEDEPGVYITICVLPGGFRELRRIRFSRERFGEQHARLWWEVNRSRLHDQYLS